MIQIILAVIERFEDVESRYHGDTSTADLPVVLKLRNELCKEHVCYLLFYIKKNLFP